jgi:hypothetical protein
LDASARSVVAWCSSCPPWRRIGPRPAALREAADHLELVHDDAKRARQLREQARRIETRHAE